VQLNYFPIVINGCFFQVSGKTGKSAPEKPSRKKLSAEVLKEESEEEGEGGSQLETSTEF